MLLSTYKSNRKEHTPPDAHRTQQRAHRSEIDIRDAPPPTTLLSRPEYSGIRHERKMKQGDRHHTPAGGGKRRKKEEERNREKRRGDRDVYMCMQDTTLRLAVLPWKNKSFTCA